MNNLVKEVDGVTPTEFIDLSIDDTDLSDYYDKNEDAHSEAKVRDWLLAEAFPATTLPMGANPNNVLDFDHNLNMSSIMKTSETDWPRNERYNGQKEWRHSDYKDIPYQHVYKFYRKIRDLTGQ